MASASESEDYVPDNSYKIIKLEITTKLEAIAPPKLQTDSRSPTKPNKSPFFHALPIPTLCRRIQADIPLHPLRRLDDTIATTDNHPDDGITSNDDDFDVYFTSVVDIRLNTKHFSEIRSSCVACTESPVFRKFDDLWQHTEQHHNIGGGWLCCLTGNSCDGITFNDADALRRHLFEKHDDVLVIQPVFTCPTCNKSFDLVVQFGKHNCRNDAPSDSCIDPAHPIQCARCPSTAHFTTHLRYQFHQLHRHEAVDGRRHRRQQWCLACGVHFADEQRFYEHVHFEHEPYALFVCRQCDRCFTDAAECRRHQNGHGMERRDFVCTACGARFRNRVDLNTHQNSHRTERLHCDQCDASFKRATNLRQHIQRTHRQPAAQWLSLCSGCGEVFHPTTTPNDNDCDVRIVPPLSEHHATCPNKPDIRRHEITHLFCCEFCERAFDSSDRLSAHRQQCAQPDDDRRETPFRCSICPRAFRSFRQRRSHRVVHRDHPALGDTASSSAQRNYVCFANDGECRSAFGDWQLLQAHRRSEHANTVAPTVRQCAECDAVFFQRWQLAHHRRAVHGQRLVCPICPAATFVLRSSLIVHMRQQHMTDKVVGEVRQYRDGVMAEYFRTVSADGTTTFTCLECGKSIRQRKNAIAHVEAVHKKIREFACDVCGKGFFGQNDLRKHVRNVHGNAVTEFECAYCGRVDGNKADLELHMRKSHFPRVAMP